MKKDRIKGSVQNSQKVKCWRCSNQNVDINTANVNTMAPDMA